MADNVHSDSITSNATSDGGNVAPEYNLYGLGDTPHDPLDAHGAATNGGSDDTSNEFGFGGLDEISFDRLDPEVLALLDGNVPQIGVATGDGAALGTNETTEDERCEALVRAALYIPSPLIMNSAVASHIEAISSPPRDRSPTQEPMSARHPFTNVPSFSRGSTYQTVAPRAVVTRASTYQTVAPHASTPRAFISPVTLRASTPKVLATRAVVTMASTPRVVARRVVSPPRLASTSRALAPQSATVASRVHGSRPETTTPLAPFGPCQVAASHIPPPPLALRHRAPGPTAPLAKTPQPSAEVASSAKVVPVSSSTQVLNPPRLVTHGEHPDIEATQQRIVNLQAQIDAMQGEYTCSETRLI
jgi:hypothetical protein